MPQKCKEAYKAYQKKYHKIWYNMNKKCRKKQIRNRKKSIIKIVQEFKSNKGCIICQEKHPAALDFHHLRDKKFLISSIAGSGYSVKTIMSEMAKCIILCANCHRKKHFNEKNSHKNIF